MQTFSHTFELHRTGLVKFLGGYVIMVRPVLSTLTRKRNNSCCAMETLHFTFSCQGHRTASASKVMASVFWDSEGFLMVDYTRVTQDWYRSVLCWVSPDFLHEVIEKKLRRKVDTCSAGAPAHTSHVAMATHHYPWVTSNFCKTYIIFQLWFCLIFICLDSWRWLGFWWPSAKWIEEQKQNFVLEGIQALEQRWEKCVAVGRIVV